MARYRKIDPRIWNDAKFAAVSDDAKLLFLFVMTHPHSTALGAFRATIPGLSAELNWPVARCREAFGQLTTPEMIEHDEQAGFIGLPNFLKYNRPESPNVVRSWSEGFDLIPECGLKDRLAARMKAFAEGLGEGFRKAFGEAFPEGCHQCATPTRKHPSPNQKQEQKQEQEQELEQDKDTMRRKRGGGDAAVVQAVVDSWNAIEGVRHVRGIAGKRGATIKARLADSDWRSNWQAALDRVGRSSFCKGGGDRGWVADLDWFIKSDTVTKLLEGKFDDVPSKPNGNANGGSHLFDSLKRFADSDSGGTP